MENKEKRGCEMREEEKKEHDEEQSESTVQEKKAEEAVPKKKRKKRYYILGAFAAVILIFALSVLKTIWPFLHIKPVEEKQLDQLDLGKYHKLMIVAHPDDEFIWGGEHLLNDDYFVVCITRGYDKTRSNEFHKMLEKTKDKGLILSYPDKIGEKRSDWTFCKKKIEKDIETVLNYKDWDEVVTHNKDGEYGHQHHIMTHQLVTDAFDQTGCKSDLYNFGKYYRVEDVPDDLNHISEKDYKKKRKLVFVYKSQMKTMRKLYHMLPHENWQKMN